MIAGAGIGLGLRGKQSNAITLPPGTTYLVPAGNYFLNLGPYTLLQYLDPVTGIWRTQLPAGAQATVNLDGANQRLANLTGCAVASVITTNSATGALTGIGATATNITVTPSTGQSVWSPVVGGAISTTAVTGVTGATVGAGYLFNPMAIISAPPPGGLQATCHITGIPTTAALLATQVIIDNQGAGYPLKSNGIANATITIINDPRDTVGAGASIQLGLTGTGLLTGLYPINQGNPGTVVPALTFSIGAAGATVLMNFTVTAFASGATNTATYATGTNPIVTSIGNASAATPVWTNPIHELKSTFPRPCRIVGQLNANSIAGTGAVIEDGGFGIQLTGQLQVLGLLLAITGVTGSLAPVATMGGIVDTSFLQPI